MNQAKQNLIVQEIRTIMQNKNYRVAHEEALKQAKKLNIIDKKDYFPFLFALDLRGEKADEFINEVENGNK